MKIISFLYIILCFVSCQNSKAQKENYYKKFVENELLRKKSIVYSDSIREFEKTYKNNNQKWIDVTKDLRKKESFIELGYNIFSPDKQHNNYSFIVDSEDNITLVIHKISGKIKRQPTYIVNDTLCFIKNRLVNWLNKTPSKKEILAKESEILAIKREIDSVLNE